jgi:hypothetical protein
LKLRSPLAKPTRANRSLVPAICAVALTAMLALQLGLTRGVDLPETGWSGGGARSQLPEIAGQFVPPILKQQSIFSPTRTAQVAGVVAVVLPLNGAVVAGMISVRGRSYAVIQQPGGTIVRLPIGGRYAGWRLRNLSADGAVFDRGSKRLPLSFGAIPAQPVTETTENEEQQ